DMRERRKRRDGSGEVGSREKGAEGGGTEGRKIGGTEGSGGAEGGGTEGRQIGGTEGRGGEEGGGGRIFLFLLYRSLSPIRPGEAEREKEKEEGRKMRSGGWRRNVLSRAGGWGSVVLLD